MCENTSTSRFVQTTKDDLNAQILSTIQKITIKKSNWAINLFSEWLKQWKVRLDGEPKVLKDIMEFNKRRS